MYIYICALQQLDDEKIRWWWDRIIEHESLARNVHIYSIEQHSKCRHGLNNHSFFHFFFLSAKVYILEKSEPVTVPLSLIKRQEHSKCIKSVQRKWRKMKKNIIYLLGTKWNQYHCHAHIHTQTETCLYKHNHRPKL